MKINFELGKEYLIRSIVPYNSEIVKVKIIDCTDTCYKVEYESGYTKYVIKSEFNSETLIIEDLGFFELITEN